VNEVRGGAKGEMNLWASEYLIGYVRDEVMRGAGDPNGKRESG
jgi:hypothetical protein